MKIISNGPLRNVREVKKYAAELQEYASPNNRRLRDMASLALRNPEAFLARPQWQRDLLHAAGYEID